MSPAPASATAPGAPVAATAPAGPNAMDTMVAQYGMSKLLAAGGALLIIVGDLVFSIFGPYGYSNIVWACAAVVLITVLVGHRLPAVIANNQNNIILIGALLAVLMSIREVLTDIAFLSTPGGVAVTYFLGALSIYGGVALMAIGAWRLQAGQR
jgi:hypothetical protein